MGGNNGISIWKKWVFCGLASRSHSSLSFSYYFEWMNKKKVKIYIWISLQSPHLYWHSIDLCTSELVLLFFLFFNLLGLLRVSGLAFGESQGYMIFHIWSTCTFLWLLLVLLLLFFCLALISLLFFFNAISNGCQLFLSSFEIGICCFLDFWCYSEMGIHCFLLS